MMHISRLLLACIAIVQLLLLGCDRSNPFGVAYISCLNNDSDAVEIKNEILRLSREAEFIIEDRSQNARSQAQSIGAQLRHDVLHDVFLMVYTSDYDSLLTLHNLDLNSGELGLTIFLENLPERNEEYAQRARAIVSSKGDIYQLGRGESRIAGMCENYL